MSNGQNVSDLAFYGDFTAFGTAAVELNYGYLEPDPVYSNMACSVWVKLRGLVEGIITSTV